ncbi:TetR/AcrR family transcriptional regulator [Nakamurella sp. PAMC28650]|jgi:AcrR family transcriptional regulator|uniref:TetR/AcrR family transcriptional regulator n=1 Tax=Nakamurella sp. PAMC28650 TaxID=2762325 RepID=UPI00164E880A|nr:TetR/AcrR family transcriptional regulator [Nakamurella sp. PAMC28650]QNK79794.1 TetR/AcrR family transcriptional regulator [Nakamurella sp. PAMC28650]
MTNPPKGSARAQHRRAEILQAAHEVFTSRGFRNGSLGEIAERVGITHQGVLHYFGSKEALLVEVLRDRDLGDRHEFREGRRPVGVAFVDHLITTVTLNTRRSAIVQAYTVLSAESVTEGHPAQAWFRDRFAALRIEVGDALRSICGPEPVVPEQELKDAASAVIAVMDGLQVQWLLDPAAVDMPRTVRAMIDALLAGWGRPPLSGVP